jgi:aspartate/glutamate racemase
MFNKKRNTDDLVYISFCPDVAITLYKVIDDKVRTIKEDTSERVRLMALRASISHELWKFNICADSILAQQTK